MQIENKIDKTEKFLLFLILILCIPAFFLNLGLMPFIEDESIRSLVAYEMLYNKDYIVPTLNGLPYYYKPPVYNWFIALSYSLTGTVNEFSSRLPTVLFLFAFCFIIYKTNRYYLDQRKSILIALFYLTCGRILFWDSFLALIDIGYSMITYLSIFLCYHFYKKESYFKFFVVPALLTAIGYLMKGLPSFIFYIGSIGSILLFHKDFKRPIKSWGFPVGILSMAGIIGIYYWLYNQQHDFSNTIGPLVDQSTRRTILRFDWIDMLSHFISYPFENIYHFFPYTLSGLMLFNHRLRNLVFQNDYLRFCFILFMMNIFVYWVSPQVYPRYILMLIPLSFSVIVYLVEIAKETNHPWWKVFEWTFIMLPFITFLASLFGFSHPDLKHGLYPVPVLGTLVVCFLILIILSLRYRKYLLWFSVLSLIITRIGFNWFFMPERASDGSDVTAKLEIIDIQKRYQDKPIRLYQKSIMDKTSSFYLATSAGYPNKIEQELSDDYYYILDTFRVDRPENSITLDSFFVREYDRTCYLIAKTENK